MFCFRCGNELPPKGAACPACDTPQKRRQRRRHRLFLGLLIFLAGGFVGSFVDTFLFRGRAWESPILKFLEKFTNVSITSGDRQSTASQPQNIEKVKVVVVPGSSSGQVNVLLPETLADPKDNISSETTELSSDAGTIPIGIAVLPEILSTQSLIVETASVGVLVPAEEPSTVVDYNLEMEAVVPLEDGAGSNYHGSISPDGKVFLFSSNRAIDGRQVFQCYFREFPQQGPVSRLFPWSGNVWTPEFSKDGNYLVFSSDSIPSEHVFLRDLATQQVKKLTTGNSKNMMPSISPDGRLIAFSSNRKGNNDIWIIGNDGNGLIQVTSGREDDREPRWWPSGEAIVFTRIQEKFKTSYIMKVSLNPLGEPEKLVDDKARNWLPDVSPDGKHLSFVRSEKPGGSGNKIHIRSIDRNQEFILAPFSGGEHYRPIWNADGAGLVFHADRNKKKSLFLAKMKKVPLP